MHFYTLNCLYCALKNSNSNEITLRIFYKLGLHFHAAVAVQYSCLVLRCSHEGIVRPSNNEPAAEEELAEEDEEPAEDELADEEQAEDEPAADEEPAEDEQAEDEEPAEIRSCFRSRNQ